MDPRRLLRARIDGPAAALLTAAIALAVSTRLYNLCSPFGFGFDGWLGAMWGQAARNLDRYGFAEMRFVPHLVSGPLKYGEVMPHLHHPPLLSNLIALSFRAFGVSEWSVRLGAAVAYLCALVLFFAIVRRLVGSRTAGLAALLFAALPMTGIYGGLPNFEPIVLAPVCGTYLFYLRFRQGGKRRDFASMVALFLLGILADWFGAFVGVPIALHALLAKPRAPRFVVPALAAAAVALVGAILAYYEWIWPGAIAEIVRQGRHRTSAVRHDFTTATYSAAEWFRVHWAYFRDLYRPGGLALGLLGPLLARLSGRAELRRGAQHAGLLALVGLQAVAVFPQASFQHAFLSFPLSLAVALGIALAAAAAFEVRHPRALRVAARAFAVLALALFVGSAQRTTWASLAASHDDRAYRDVGRAIARATEFGGAVATPGTDLGVWIPVSFYADRAIYHGVGSLDALDALRRRPPRPSAPVRYVVFTRSLFAEHEAFARALLARHASAYDGLILILDLGVP